MPFLRLFTPQSRSRRAALAAALLWTVMIFVLCLWPGEELPKSDIPFIDKWVHFGLFGGFSFLWLCAFPSRRVLQLIVIAAAGCALGWFVECLQGWFPSLGRTKDVKDALADGVGSVLGVLFFYVLATAAVRKGGGEMR